jgi:hypothetical protein
MYDMINICATPSQNKDFIVSNYDYWRRRYISSVPEFSAKEVTYTDDGTPRMPWGMASELMVKQMRQFKKINSHGR